MRPFSRVAYLILVVTLVLTACSSRAEQSAPVPSTTLTSTSPAVTIEPTDPVPSVVSTNISPAVTTTAYPIHVAENEPYLTIFGVDGKTNLEKMREAGVDWLRVNTQLEWSQIEINEGRYDWSKAARVEDVLRNAAENNMQAILIIQTAPTWARKYPGSLCGPIKEEKYAAFGDFLYEVVRRYSQAPYHVTHYQIWNEPDGLLNNEDKVFGCWGDGSDEYYGGLAYGQMLAQIYPRAKEANPNAQVIVGSLMLLCDARDPEPQKYCQEEKYRKVANFFEGVVRGAQGAFDMVMFNSGPSYVKGENPVWNELNNWRWENDRGGLVNGKINYIRETMAKYGISKPIIHSEAYFLDRPKNSPEDFALFEQYKADYLVWVYANAWAQGLKAVTWYSIEGWKGSELLRDGQETEAYQALKAMIGLLRDTEYISREDTIGYSRFVYQRTGEEIWLLIPAGQQYGMSYLLPKPSTLKQVVNLLGERQAVDNNSGEISFSRPIYVILNR